MSGWVVLGIYVLGYVGSFIKVQPALIDDVVYGEPDGMDRAMSSALAAIVCLFWPLFIPFYGLHRLAKMGSRKEREAVISKRERELTEREERIVRLERELGIGKDRTP